MFPKCFCQVESYGLDYIDRYNSRVLLEIKLGSSEGLPLSEFIYCLWHLQDRSGGVKTVTLGIYLG